MADEQTGRVAGTTADQIVGGLTDPNVGPKVGDVRTLGAETRQWDGHAWRPVPRTFLGSEDFAGRMKRYAFGDKTGPGMVGTTVSDLASTVLHPLDTLAGVANSMRRTATGAAQAVMHPSDPVNDMGFVSDVGHLIRAALQGDPAAAGHLAAMYAAPKAADATLNGVNSAAHAIAENPKVRSGLGYTTGAGTALLTGVGHPFIGAAIGRMVSPLLKGPAAEVASATDWIKNAIHGTGTDAAAGIPENLRAGYLDVLKAAGKDKADLWLERQTAPKATAPDNNAPATNGNASSLSSLGQQVYDRARQTGQRIEIVDPLNGETADQWRARVQAQIDRAKPNGSKSATLADTSEGADQLGELPDAIHGPDAPTIPNGGTTEPPFAARGTAKPGFTGADYKVYLDLKSGNPVDLTNAKVQASLQKLRDSYGAERAARMLGQKGTDVIRQAAPGPSQLPMTVRTRIAMDVKNLKTAADARAYLAKARDAKAIAYIQGLYQKFGIPTGE